jgi:hypothetical protein
MENVNGAMVMGPGYVLGERLELSAGGGLSQATGRRLLGLLVALGRLVIDSDCNFILLCL